jgi:hypothetical protein
MAPDADAGKSVKPADPFAPLTSEQLAVSDGHDIYVESVGRVGGFAAVYLHGGPGSGCQPDHRRLFDPERFHAVLFDQRGAGRSRPKGRREANTLPHLIADMEAIRNLVERHVDYTESPRGKWILENWAEMLPKFVKVFPHEFKRVMGVPRTQEAVKTMAVKGSETTQEVRA